jgi:hypothetical protein
MDNPAKQPLMKNVPPVPVDHLVGHLIQPGTTSKALRANKPRRCWSWLDHTWLMIFRSLQDSELWPSYSGRVTLPDDGVEFLSGETMIHPRHLPRTGVLKPVEELRMEGTEVSVAIDPIEGRKENGGKRKSVKDFAASVRWKDRTDFKDGVDYVNRIRKFRLNPTFIRSDFAAP